MSDHVYKHIELSGTSTKNSNLWNYNLVPARSKM